MADQPEAQEMVQQAAAAVGDKKSASTYYPNEGDGVPLFFKRNNIYLHGIPCKCCASCESCSICIKCKCCDPCCLKCMECCPPKCPCCDPCCLKCKACCAPCPGCDISCKACFECNCHPKCNQLCACDCGPECELTAVGCELCPGPLKGIFGNWHIANNRFPKKIPAIIFPCCCGPQCPQIPCPGGKNETFENEDFSKPGAVGPDTGKVACLGLCCPNVTTCVAAMIPAQFQEHWGANIHIGGGKILFTLGDGPKDGGDYSAGAAPAAGAAGGEAAAPLQNENME